MSNVLFIFLQDYDDDDDNDDNIDKNLTPSTSDNPKFIIDSEEKEEDDDGEKEKEKDDDGNLTKSYDIEEEGEEV